MTEQTSAAPASVVIAGGGVAALEALIALRDLAGDRVRVTLVAPTDHFVYRPLSVAEPFCLGQAAHHPLRDVARDFGADVIRGTLRGVDADRSRVLLDDGTEIAYDSLLIAVGARTEPAFRHGITFGAEGAPEALSGLLADLEGGYARRVAFVVPSGTGWSLPLYELAIMTARDAWAAGMNDVELTLVSPEERPLEMFGPEASATVGELLSSEGITFVGGTGADVEQHAVIASDRRIGIDRVVTLPALVGPNIEGLPAGDRGFIPVDEHGRVQGLADVYAAGDATDSPVKQGGLAAQQAVAAAESIAARHGADLEPEPYRPVLRGMLLTGGRERWMKARAGDAGAYTNVSVQALWWPPTKIATRYLAPYLMGRDEAAALREPAPGSGRRVDQPVVERVADQLGA
jgi:sulfide:quinone oxidoreductase